jgi:hypothetical protein
VSALFPDLAAAVTALKSDQLLLLASSLLGNKFAPTNPYLEGKLKSAEADAERRLRVFFEPVTVFAYEPTDEEIAALPQGTRYVEESAYDYEPASWGTEDWGYLVLRKSPVVSVESVVFFYPSPASGVFTMPKEWIRLDKKAGHLRFVPSGSTMSISAMSATMLSAMSGGRVVPQMIQIKYRAGLRNVANEYPDLVDLVKKMAVLRIVQDAYLPQSGSISADGMSQSISVDMSVYHEGVDDAIDSLLQSIHGVRCTFL